MLFHLTVLLLCQLVGEVLVRLLGLPVPGPVAGMAILFLGLVLNGKVPDGLETVSRTILNNLALLLVPASVGVMVHLHVIAAELIPIAAAVIISTALTIVVTGLLMQWLSPKDPP